MQLIFAACKSIRSTISVAISSSFCAFHCSNLRRDVEASDDEDDAKVAQQPVKVLRGEDNTNKTAEQMQGDEVPPQV